MGHITPKLHLLETHTIPFIRRFRVGLGLLGEQSSESIHARFNSLGRDYHAITNSAQRLEAISQQHLVQPCLSTSLCVPLFRQEIATHCDDVATLR